MIFLILVLLPVLSLCQRACPPQPIDVPAAQLVSEQPLYYNLVPSYVGFLSLDTGNIDNICLNYFPLTDCTDQLMAYFSWVYCNGSNIVQTYLVGANTTGVLYYSSPFRRNYEHIVFATDGNTDYLYQYYGPNEGYPIGLTSQYKQPPSHYRSIFRQFGYDNQPYRVLPRNLPSRCVTSMTCSANCRGCQTNNKQSRSCQNYN